MKTGKTNCRRCADRMRSSRSTGPNTAPLPVQGYHLLCAVCVRGGCGNPPSDKQAIGRLLKTIWSYPYAALQVLADADVTRAHYSDVYEERGKKPLPPNFRERRNDYANRKKDLEVCRILGIVPNTVIPAFFAYQILFQRKPNLEGLCRREGFSSAAWPECPHARKGWYEKIAGESLHSLEEQTRLGEKLDGKGIWAMVRPRTREDMKLAKEKSARHIIEKSKTLYMRPQHALCLLCRPRKDKILIEDNLIEFIRRMEADPDIPVTLVEGCCQACDPCNEYHPSEHICYHTHFKNSLRDLLILEHLGLAPGAMLPARKLYALIYERIGSLKDICGWGDGSNTAPYWAPCRYEKPYLDQARREGFISGTNCKSP